MEATPASPVGERNASYHQRPREKCPRESLASPALLREQPQDLSTEILAPKASSNPDSHAREAPQGAGTLAPGLEGDSDGLPGAPGETLAHLPTTSQLWRCPDGSFVKKILVRGHGLDKPKLGSRCRVRASGLPVESGLAEAWTELTVGMGPWREDAWGELIEKCLESMCEGEEAELLLPGRAGPPVRLTLAAFTPGKETWEMEASEKEALAKEEHARGTELFRAGDPERAARCYGRALRLLLTFPPPGPPERTVLQANLAACQLLLGLPHLAAQNCDRVLEREPNHVKALYRRGVAQAALGNLDEATADLRKVLALDPKNRAAQEELGKVIIQGKKQDARLAQGLRKMFG